MGIRITAALAAAMMIATACTRSGEPAPRATPTASPTVSAEPTVSPTPSPVIPVELASGRLLPDACEPRAASPTAYPVAFAARGAAWAVDADGRRVRCLFAVDDPGPFTWGPLGDRVLLGGFELRQTPDVELRASGDLEPVSPSWGHPEGLAVAFVSSDGNSLEKVLLDRGAPLDVSPYGAGIYREVTYHPSGLFLAFVVERGGEESIRLASNVGEEPRRLVFTREDTTFGPLSFEDGGRYLFYGAMHRDGHPELHRLDLVTGAIPAFWQGEPGQEFLGVQAGPTRAAVAFDVGTSCDDSVTMVQTERRGTATPALDGETRPTRALGWLGRHRLLVSAGDCEGPLDLYVFDTQSVDATRLVTNIDAASVRLPRPSPDGLPAQAEVEVPPGAA